ncbi:fec operon regulator FecR [compost metagenome]
MDGEAFFEVKPDVKRPFIIHSDHMVTRVWGTSFLVRSVKGGAEEVSVVTGKVSVRLQEQNDDAAIMLMPDQKVTLLKAGNILKKESELKNSAVRIWQKTSLFFDNKLLRDVLPTLNKKFGVSISTTNKSLLNYSLTADFTDQSLPAILEMLEKSMDLKYEINEGQIILYN